MKKFFLTACTLLFATAIFAAAKTSSADMYSHIPYKSAVWKSKTTVQDQNQTISFEQTTYFKEKKMRTEGAYVNPKTNEKESQIIIVDSKSVYMINPDTKQGVIFSLKSSANPKKTEVEIAKCRQSGKKTGSDNINGTACDVYEYGCTVSGRAVKVKEWRNSKDGFIIRTVSVMNKITTTVDITDLKPNIDIPDSKFVPNSDIKFIDMAKMMRGKR